MMSATPISLAATSAYAHPPEECDKLDHKHGLKFGLIASRLWEAFLKGVDLGRQPGMKPVSVKRDVFQKAAKMSGPYVLASLDKFDPNGDHMDVYRCCMACGIAAAGHAYLDDPDNPVIDQAIFHQAWCDTKACYNAGACKVKHIDPLPGNPSPDPFPQAPLCPEPNLANMSGGQFTSVGCG
jgi:hypothetical protein